MSDNKTPLPDVQSSADDRHIAIDRVGVRSVTVPVEVDDEQGRQASVAEVSMTVDLAAEHKGTHMSRFVALLAEELEPLSAASVERLLAKMIDLLEARDGYIEFRLPFFVTKPAPVTGLKSLMNYKVRFLAERRRGRTRVVQEIAAPVTSLCPCSKEISAYGAHNQRSELTIAAELNAPMSLLEQIRIAETSASCELWSRLKRADEKWVTERAYDNPKFVEDIIRDMARQLNAEPRVDAYRIEAENFESIHNHSAYALIERDKRQA